MEKRRGIPRSVEPTGAQKARYARNKGGAGVSERKHFDRARTSFYTGRMEVKLSPELQAKLESIAAQQGRDSASLVHEAVERLIGYDEWFMRQVEKGLAQVERGETLPHDEVAARMEKLITEKHRRR